MRANRLQEIWAGGKQATNIWLGLPSMLAAESISHQGWDSITVDMQHGHIDFASMVAMLTAISTTATVPLVRVPWNEPGDVMRALDAGAYGVICPNIDTREQCERFVGACRYAPLGYRSVGPRRAVLYGGSDYIAKANETVLAAVQVESAVALKNVAEIAAVKSLDMIYVGPTDLALSLGRDLRAGLSDAVLLEAIDKILAAAKAANVRTGIYCRNADDAKAMLTRGFDLVTVTSDDALLAAGAGIAAKFR
jgi:4-hydroxy-2-oxoheptanedioate aldolase